MGGSDDCQLQYRIGTSHSRKAASQWVALMTLGSNTALAPAVPHWHQSCSEGLLAVGGPDGFRQQYRIGTIHFPKAPSKWVALMTLGSSTAVAPLMKQA